MKGESRHRPRRRSRRSRLWPRRSARARADAEAAERLTRQLGGTDQYVKEYFLALPPSELKPFLDDYESWFGRDARRRAERTLPRWRSGTLEMSWRMIRRLYRLLPPRMSAEERYELAAHLWHHVGPSSRITFRVGLDASEEDVLSAVAAHLDRAVAGYRIPEALRVRFEWLSAADVVAKQDLLGRAHELEKSLIVEAATSRMPIVLRHMQSEAGRLTERLAQTFTIGKHELELVVDRNASGVATVEPTPNGSGSSGTRTFGRALRSLVGVGPNRVSRTDPSPDAHPAPSAFRPGARHRFPPPDRR